MSPGAAAAAWAARIERWAAIALGFSLPISTALDNALLAVAALGYAASADWRAKGQLVASNPVALSALALFALLAAAAVYGTASARDALGYLEKYLELLWIPIFLHAFRSSEARTLAIHGFAASVALVLAVSTSLKLGWLPKLGPILGDAAYPVVTKHRITHALLMALGAFLFAQLALAARTRSFKLLWSALAPAALANALLAVPSGTGYVVLAVLALFFGYGLGGRRGLAAAAALAGVATAGLALAPGPFGERGAQIVREALAWRPGEARIDSSVGLRLEFYRVSLEIVREHPFAGVGTGGFPRAYAEKAPDAPAARNPHNEYLMIAVQTGTAGFALLLNLFFQHWRFAARLPSALEQRLARALVLAIATGSLFNSLLLDHTEGLLYAWMTGLLFAGIQSRETETRA